MNQINYKRHVPVLTNEVMDILFNQNLVDKDPIIVDCTVGLGGHAKLILEKLNDQGFLFGFDLDKEAIDVCTENLINLPFSNFKLINKSYVDVKSYLLGQGIFKIDVAFFDLGVSSLQIDDLKRGFSYNQNCLLDMRMDTTSKVNAQYILNRYSNERLIGIFKKYGLGLFSSKLANKIIHYRKAEGITRSEQLTEIVRKTVFGSEVQIKKYVKLLFQAIRLEVNKELDVFSDGLKGIWELLKNKGLLIVITFHSLEERVLKNFFKAFKPNPKLYKLPVIDQEVECYKLINKKPILPSLSEVITNKRASSAKLWTFQKLK
ncbi:16S rRNA (cytosine(1402)-N(4))-methyltransferase RsmH [Mycoplasma sp. SG1]|uniref:16S rRNA (cytosine(1402)-N(4))-methyltransferase RsmH n=1 Tax=Mycoplasma sp. SG1 TaxID=2810348 RepID=UPI0020254886|nr:16S rRNA (cytosine(1402)-N(4))-methyltransferase RsmH [Mycoplasma sp. SG1]URM53184.1 16S rRNA (cytosine(1402)-N(4))-methyltransferase RsmH [Mycoplasma sp. SG1]